MVLKTQAWCGRTEKGGGIQMMGHLTRMESSYQKFQAKSGSNGMKEKLPERF